MTLRPTSGIEDDRYQIVVGQPAPHSPWGWEIYRNGEPLPARLRKGASSCPSCRLCRALHSHSAGKPPSGPGWVHEIKHDGYRLIVRRDGDTVRLFTRRMDVRLAAGNVDRMRMFAKELVGLQPDVIIVGGTPNTQRNMGNSGS